MRVLYLLVGDDGVAVADAVVDERSCLKIGGSDLHRQVQGAILVGVEVGILGLH